MLGRLAHYTHLTDRMRDHVARAAFPSDIVAAKAAGRHCIYQTCNGVPLPGEQATVEQELRFISQFFELGCRMMHLTYNRRNPIGDGCAEPANAGLSDFGRAVITEMNKVGVIADVAHSGWQTCLDAAEVSQKPIVASHSACAALNHHHRCKPGRRDAGNRRQGRNRGHYQRAGLYRRAAAASTPCSTTSTTQCRLSASIT